MARMYYVDNVGGEYDLEGFMRDVYEGGEYANPLDNDLLDMQYSTVAGVDDTSELWDESNDVVGFYDISDASVSEYTEAIDSEVSGSELGATYILNKQSDCWPGAKLKTVSAMALGRKRDGSGGFYWKGGKKLPLPSHIKYYDKVRVCWQGRSTGPASNLFKAASKNVVVKKAAKLSGDIVSTANTVARLPAKAVKATLGNVPIIGTPIKALVNLSPTEAIGGLSARIIAGERIDKAFLKTAKSQIKNARELAPYVQTVMSVVPGVGTGVSAAIAAGIAIADGRTVTDAVLSSVKAAIPGGPVAAMAFDTGVALTQGKRLDRAALNAAANQLPAGAKEVAKAAASVLYGASPTSAAFKAFEDKLPPAAADALKTGIKLAKNPAQREAIVKEAVLRGIQANLPQSARKGLDVGIAMATGRNIQSAVVNKAASKTGAERLYRFGSKVYAKSTQAQKLARGLSKPRLAGFKAGLGAASASGVNAHALAALRQALPETQRAGFDHALKATLNKAQPNMVSLVANGRVLRGNWRPVSPNTPGAIVGRLVKGNKVVKGYYSRIPEADIAALASLSPKQQAQLRALAAARK